MASGTIPDEIRVFIVQSLACFDGCSAVMHAVKREFDFDVSRQAVEVYDPTKRAGRALGERWRTLFEETRTKFIDDHSAIAISHRTTRLRMLQRLAEKAEVAEEIEIAASLIEQAAKEMGNFYTNRRELTGKDGRDLPNPIAAVVTLDEILAARAEIVDEC